MEEVNQSGQKLQGNWVPISKALLCELPLNRPYTRLEAMFSLTVDYDTGNQATVNGYSSLWSWSREKVRNFMQGIGVSIEYPEATGISQNQRGNLKQITDRCPTDNRQINFIDSKWLRDTKDRNPTDDRQMTDTTINPNPNPNPNPKNKKTSSPKPKKPVSPDALRLSELLADMILDNNPQNRCVNNGKRDGSVQKWAADIDKIIRIDNQEPAAIEKVIRWSQADTFWKMNILSGSKLREKWDRLSLKTLSVTDQQHQVQAAPVTSTLTAEQIRKTEELRYAGK